MSQFSFEYPLVLGLIVLFVVCAKWCKARNQAIYFPHVEQLLLTQSSKASWVVWLKWVGIVLAIVALASPVRTQHYTHSKKEGRDIVLVLDASESMRQYGFDPQNPYKSKFAVVKEVVEAFITKRINDRLGLVTFADVAFIASPLTFEREFLQDITRMQELGVAGKRTAINDAIVQSYTLLESSRAKSKIIILLTDGVDNMSKVPLDQLQSMMEKQHVKLYTIGIGRANRDYDAGYLTALAKAGGGVAYGAKDASMLLKIYEEINALEVTKIDDKQVVEHTYLYIYPLFLAILSLLLFIYLRSTKGV